MNILEAQVYESEKEMRITREAISKGWSGPKADRAVDLVKELEIINKGLNDHIKFYNELGLSEAEVNELMK